MITNLDDLIKSIQRYKRSNLWIFRGQSISEWSIIPKAGRPEYKDYDDIALLESWKRRSSILLEKLPTGWWEWLTVAQHYGLPTRLVDWTYNPLIAAYFACNEDFDIDGIIYAYKYKSRIIPEKSDPFKLTKIHVFRPTATIERIVNQSGIFTIHPKPDTTMDEHQINGTLEKLIISHECKKELIFNLNQLGINQATIFPDIEGLAKHICWAVKNMNYWTDSEKVIE